MNTHIPDKKFGQAVYGVGRTGKIHNDKMEKSLYKRQKIVMLFALGIGCPSLILGYLAFRGVQNDQALLEKERLTEHRQIAQKITESVADSLAKIEAVFIQTIIQPAIIHTSVMIDSIHRIKHQYTSKSLFFSTMMRTSPFPLQDSCTIQSNPSKFPLPYVDHHKSMKKYDWDSNSSFNKKTMMRP